MQDPIFDQADLAGQVTGAQVLSWLASQMNASGTGAIGFIEDKYVSSAPHGPELYFRTRSNFGTEAFFSMKYFTPDFGDPGLLQIWMNTGFDGDKRVDNQPGMFAKTFLGPENAVDAAEVFNGDWDDGGVNASTINPSEYKTVGATPTTPGPVVTLDEGEAGLWFPNNGGTDDFDVWYLYDQNQGASPARGGSRSLAVIWYTQNAMMGFVLGKVMYDDEAPGAVDKLNGNLLTTWQIPYDSVGLTLPLPINDSLGGEISTPATKRHTQEIIRSFTPAGGSAWPTGTPDGSLLAKCGTVVLNEGHLECGDDLGAGDKSAHHRPDQRFSESYNSLQPNTFPNPRMTVYYDHTNQRRAFCRHRYVARVRGGEVDPNSPPTDWLDSSFYFPWYYAPVRGMHPGDIDNNGTRQYMVFPGTRGGDENADAARYAGIAFRLVDLP